MNFKTTKDTIIRVAKDFIGVTAVGAMFVLICMMFCIESITFSKEVIGLLLGTSILCLGIGGLTSAVLIFFFCCTKKISKLEKVIAHQDKIILNQQKQLREANAYSTPIKHTTETVTPCHDNKILKEIESLSEEVPLDESIELEEELIPSQEPVPPQESVSQQDSPVTEDI